MPVTPYPVDGTVYDRNGSTLLNAATVVVLNVTTGEKISGVTDASGNFLVDLANLTSAYSNGDKLQLTAFYGSGSAIRCLSKRHTVNTTLGSWEVGNLVLHAGNDNFADCHIVFAAHTNSHSSGLYVDYYDRTNDAFVFRLEALAGTTYPLPIGYAPGIKMDGGFIRIFESETTGLSEVLTVFK